MGVNYKSSRQKKHFGRKMVKGPDAQFVPWDSSEAASYLLPETLDSSGLCGLLALTFSA